MRLAHLLVAISVISHVSMNHALSQTSQSDSLKELSRRLDILTEEIEKAKLGEVAERTYESRYGMGPAASQVYHLKKAGVSLAGYGEVVYENYADETDAGAASNRKDQIDFVRQVVYTGFRFNDRLLFNAEIEFEHAKTGSGSPGEVSVEFGYVEAGLTNNLSVRAGMLLIPIGIINELHEPPTFFGALRPETERQVIPATWRANGGGIVAETGQGLGLKLYMVEGLNAQRFAASGIRSGRQNGAQAVAEDLAFTGQVYYGGVAGLNVGGSFFSGKSGQGLEDSTGAEIGARTTVLSAHGMYSWRGLTLRALYARVSIDEVLALNSELALTGNKSIGETQEGYYLTVAYDVLPLFKSGTTAAVLPFVQYEKLNTQKDVPAGFSLDKALERTNLTFGVSYKPHPNVAFKADLINRDNEANTAVDQFNVGATYLF